MKKKWLLIIGAGVVLAVLVVLALKSNQVKRTTVTVELARRGKIRSLVTATGKVQAQADVEISADVMGRIEELPVEEGQRVTEGQLLVKIDNTSRRMDVAQARGSLQSAVSAREKEVIDLEREKQLFAKGLSSQASLDIARNAFDQAESQLQIGQASLDRALDQLNKCTIRSPMAGIVTKLNSEKGENVVIGTMNNPGTVIMVISDLSAMEIETEVDETDIARVDLEQEAEITLDAFPDTTFRGKAVQIGNSPKSSGFGSSDQITNFVVKILILDRVANIKPGMTASVDITTNEKTEAIKIPAGSVVMRPENTGVETKNAGESDSAEAADDRPAENADIRDIDGVFLVSQGKSRFVPVKMGIRDQQHVEILDGVAEGDSVISGPYRLLRTLKHDEMIKPEAPKFGPDKDLESD